MYNVQCTINNKKIVNSEKGQTLIELIVAVTISVIIVGALVFATIASLRNSQFSKYQSQATKLAQEGIEKVRSARDRGGSIQGGFTLSGVTVTSWSDMNLWNNRINSSCLPDCYFKFISSNFSYLTSSTSFPSNPEDPLGDGKFKRVVILSDDGSTYGTQKTVTVIVKWTDFSGPHQSQLTTVLGKL